MQPFTNHVIIELVEKQANKFMIFFLNYMGFPIIIIINQFMQSLFYADPSSKNCEINFFHSLNKKNEKC